LVVAGVVLASCSPAVPSSVKVGTPAPCASAPGQAELMSRLAGNGVPVIQLAGSTSQPLIGASAVVCYVKIRAGAFEAAFFTDAGAAEQFRVCETRSGSRYLYRVNGKTMDAAYPVHWSRAGTVVVWAYDQDVDRMLSSALHPVSVSC